MKNTIHWMRIIVVMLLLTAGFSSLLAQSDSGEDTPAGKLTNQLNPFDGADPWLQYYEGNYYLATTTWRSELIIFKSPTLAGLKTATPIQIYAETDPSRCCN